MIAKRIRQMRLKQGLTVSALARLAGVSKSMISQIENGSASPSIETVRTIASALEVPLFTLFLEDRDSYSALVRKSERIKVLIPDSQGTRELLTPDLQRKMALIAGRIPPHTLSSPPPIAHQGEECVVVLRGTLTVQLHEETYLLEEGDTLYFNPQLPHHFHNRSDTEVEFISVVTPPVVYNNNMRSSSSSGEVRRK